jgi:hypothetical protein
MPHLTLETLARLVDEPPDTTEAQHLEVCDECRAEFESMRADVAALAILPPRMPGDAVWRQIERRARNEGLVRVPAHSGHAWKLGLLRVAAAVLVFAMGTTAGLAWARSENTIAAGAAPDIGSTGVETTASIDDRGPVSETRVEPPVSHDAIVTPVSSDAGVPVMRGGGIEFGPHLVAAREPRTAEETTRFFAEAEALYFYAMSRAAELEPTAPRDDMIARLATLEYIVNVAGTALNQAPADPVINSYYLASMAQRDATLRRISVSNVNSW